MDEPIAAAYERAKTSYPDIALGEATFRRHLVEHRWSGRRPQLVSERVLGDLFLACACAMRIEGAATLL
jgi:hypothetical protein